MLGMWLRKHGSSFSYRPLGLISLLDEECTFPKGTDYTFADKLKEHLNGKICFKAERGRAFCIRHYAGEVTYDTLGFLEKNKDLLHSDLLQILASCGTALPQLFSVKIEQGLQKLISPVRRSGTESQKQSVATKFKEQLSRLMQKLENTEPHFIRCIKPNTLQQPNLYEEDLVLQQLRCCGVLEVVRISRSGYPTRVSHQKFASRYGFLHPQYSTSQKDVLNICVAILHQFGVPPEMYQVGYTKLFLRAGQIGRMEDCRLQTLHGIIYFQKLYRGYRTRCCFRTLKRATLLLQSLVRGRKVRKEFDIRRKKHRAAMVIQRFIRCRAERKAYLRIREKVLVIQLVARGWLARKKRLALQSQVEHESSRQKGLGSEAPRKMRETLVSEGPTYNTSGLEAKDTNFMVTEVMHMEAEATAIVSPSFLAKLKSRALYAEAALREKEVDNAFLHQRLNQYETRWSEYEANISYLEEMWQMQMTSLQLSLTAAKKSLASQGPSSQALKYDGIFPVKSGVTKQRATQHILPHDDDDDDDNDNDFNWDENTSVETKTPDNSLTPRKAPSDISLTRRDLDAGQSVISHLAKEFEHCKQVFMDDAEFLMEVKSGQTEASLNPDDELRKLKQRFNAWKKDFKCRLRGTKYVLQKLGNGDSAQKMKKNWWRKRKVQLQYRGVVI